MTIATTRTEEFTVNEIVTAAYRLAGLVNEGQTPSQAKRAAGCKVMQFVLQELEAEGLFARTTVFQYVQLVAGTQSYALDASVVNVVGAWFIPAGQGDTTATSDSVLSAISQEEWANISPKDGTGDPTQFWLDRSVMTLWLDPIPSTAGRLRCRVQQLRASSLDGNATPDVERFWVGFLRWKVAHDLAVSASRNLGTCSYLERQASEAYSKARDAARPRLDNQFYIA